MTYSDLLLVYARRGWWRPLRQSAYRKFCRRNRDKLFVTITQNGFPIKTIIGDSVDNKLFVYGIFEGGTTRVIDALGMDCDGFVDVGCNIGYYSCLFGHRHPDKPVLAVDPNPEMIHRIAENLEFNHIENYALFPWGIGARRERLTLNISKLRHSLSSFAYVPKTGLDERIEVDVKPLGDLFAGSRIENALVKIDAEGFEYPIFQGVTEETADRIRYIVFELSMPNIIKAGASPEAFLLLPVIQQFDAYRIDDGTGRLTGEELADLVSDPKTNINVLLVKKGRHFDIAAYHSALK